MLITLLIACVILACFLSAVVACDVLMSWLWAAPKPSRSVEHMAVLRQEAIREGRYPVEPEREFWGLRSCVPMVILESETLHKGND